MGDPSSRSLLDPLGIRDMLTDIFKRLRNLEKPTGLQVANGRLKVKSVNTSEDVNAGGNVTGANVSAFGTVGGTNVNASVGVTAPQGTFTAGVTSVGARTKTLTNSPVQAFIDAAGNIGVSASTLAKKNITGPYQVDMAKFLAVELKTWAYKDNPQATGMGPVADALDAAGLTEFVLYNVDGTVQGIRSDMLVIGLMSAYMQSRTATLTRIGNQKHQVVTLAVGASIALGGTRPFTITWPTPFVDNDYMTSASIVNVTTGIVVAGASAAVVQSSKTAAGCTVVVAAGIAISTGQALVVEAVHI